MLFIFQDCDKLAESVLSNTEQILLDIRAKFKSCLTVVLRHESRDSRRSYFFDGKSCINLARLQALSTRLTSPGGFQCSVFIATKLTLASERIGREFAAGTSADNDHGRPTIPASLTGFERNLLRSGFFNTMSAQMLLGSIDRRSRTPIEFLKMAGSELRSLSHPTFPVELSRAWDELRIWARTSGTSGGRVGSHPDASINTAVRSDNSRNAAATHITGVKESGKPDVPAADKNHGGFQKATTKPSPGRFTFACTHLLLLRNLFTNYNFTIIYHMVMLSVRKTLVLYM